MAERRIGSRVYRYDRQTGPDSLRVLLRALKLLVPASDLIEAVASGNEEAEPAALMALIAAMDSEGIVDLLTALVSQAREDGRLIENTSGLLSREEFAQVALFALQTEVGDFFRDGPGAVVRKAGIMLRAPNRTA